MLKLRQFDIGDLIRTYMINNMQIVYLLLTLVRFI